MLGFENRRLIATEMRMLRLIWGKTLNDKITNGKVRELTGVDEMKEFLRGQRLRWLGHVERVDENRGPAKALHFQINGSKKGRPKKRWIEVLEKDMHEKWVEKNRCTGLRFLET